MKTNGCTLEALQDFCNALRLPTLHSLFSLNSLRRLTGSSRQKLFNMNFGWISIRKVKNALQISPKLALHFTSFRPNFEQHFSLFPFSLHGDGVAVAGPAPMDRPWPPFGGVASSLFVLRLSVNEWIFEFSRYTYDSKCFDDSIEVVFYICLACNFMKKIIILKIFFKVVFHIWFHI